MKDRIEIAQKALELARRDDSRAWTAREARLAAYIRDLFDKPDWRHTQPRSGE